MPYSGTVVRVDEAQRVLVFDDGKMWQTAGDSMVLIDGKPRVVGTVQPGTRVTVQQGYPVEYRDGRYGQVMPPAAGSGVRQTHMIPSIKKGDAVQLDITIPGGAPSAFPR